MIFHFIWLLFRRSYAFLFLTFFSLVIGGFLFGTVFSFTKSASTYLLEQGKVLTGGDIVLSSSYPIDTTIPVLKSLQDKGYILSNGEDLQAVFTSGNSSSTAASTLRLVSTTFPLYGNVTLENGSEFTLTPGTIYAEKAFLDRIGVKTGGTVTLSDKKFIVKGVLIKEPDTISFGISFTPKVIMSLDDFSKLSPLFSQSRINYKVYIAQNPVRTFTADEKKSLENYAKQNKIRFDDATNGPNNLIRGLSSVSKFIGIVLSVTLFLVVINIGANLVYVLARFRKAIALLKIHGATNKQIQVIYVVLLTLVGFFAGALGATIGATVTSFGIDFVEKLLVITLTKTSVFFVVPLGGIFGAVFILVSALPFLQALTKVHPKELLMNQVQSSQKFSLKNVLVYIPVPILLIVILYAVTKDIFLSLISVATCIGLFLLFMALSYGLIKYFYIVRNRLSFIMQSIVSYLYIRSMRTSITTASVMTAFCGVFIVIAVQSNITFNLHRNVAITAPSLYLVDMTKSEREGVKRIVGSTYVEYPIVRGRLVMLNGRNISELNNQELQREFNMTYRDTLINGEKVTAGTFGGTTNVKNPVSIDKAFADDLGGVQLGDTLTVFIQGITITTTITSIREVDSRSGIPFFYLVFPPSVLASFPAAYFATANVTGDELKNIEDAVGREYPNIIPVATGLILATIASLLNTAITVVTVVGFPSIALGLLLILVMLWQSLYERSGDVLVMRAFGLERKRVTQLFIIETGLLSAASGIIAYLVAHLVAYLLNKYLFSFILFTFAVLPLYIIIGNVVLVCILSYFLSYRLTNTSLKKLLAEK
jgi:putative ABC transport system permease protein